MTNPNPKAPKAHDAFVRQFPKLGEAWDAMRAAEDSGPYGKRELRLLKLAIAVGAGKEGHVHSSVRKAISAGCSEPEILHVVALAASTIGLPAAVAAYAWTAEELDKMRAIEPGNAAE